ncbi:hypothetical protein ACFL3F_01740 [Planctomycetota bacterium]
MFGQLQPSDLPSFGSELAVLLEEHDCVRILNDLRDVDLRLSLMDICRIPDLVTESGIKGNTKRAIVFSKDAGDYQFYETVSVNRGQFVRVFTDFDEAETWLTALP